MNDSGSYFSKFVGMTPYLTISEEEFTYIKENFDKDFARERLAEVCMTYPLPYADISKEDAQSEFMKLKGIRWNEVLTEGEWFPRKAADTR